MTNSGFDSASSRANYAVFHAVTALFALEDSVFTKHSAPQAAVHRDLVKARKWSDSLGRDFSLCAALRAVGDYGTQVRIEADQAAEALASARRILTAVREALPATYPSLPGADN